MCDALYWIPCFRMSSINDPLGLLSPYTTLAATDYWHGWDSKLSKELSDEVSSSMEEWCLHMSTGANSDI